MCWDNGCLLSMYWMLYSLSWAWPNFDLNGNPNIAASENGLLLPHINCHKFRPHDIYNNKNICLKVIYQVNLSPKLASSGWPLCVPSISNGTMAYSSVICCVIPIRRTVMSVAIVRIEILGPAYLWKNCRSTKVILAPESTRDQRTLLFESTIPCPLHISIHWIRIQSLGWDQPLIQLSGVR